MSELVLRPLAIGEILDMSFTLYRRQFATLLVIAIMTTGIPLILQIYLLASGGYLQHPILLGVFLVLSVSMSALATAAAVHVVSESYLGRSLGTSEAFRRAAPMILPVILTSLAFTFLVGLGTMFFIVPGVILACGLAVAFPALVVERSSTGTALSRSWNLTRGFKGKMFLLFLVIWIIILLPSVTIGAIAGMFAGGAMDAGSESSGMIITLVSGLVQIVVYPLLYCALTVAYYDLRVRKEAFDLEVLETALKPAAV